jgi:hypothetical protein
MRQDFTPLLATLEAVTTRRSTVLLAHEHRTDHEHVFFAALDASFRRERVPPAKLHRTYASDDIHIYRLTRR